ncbi:MAG: rhamnulose-1-phosphate aldolase, partial [Megasphaera micronuciformis]|nr:rhamnulose-1-phosphate aldolase [Megasphaera micronuciformis]
MYIEEMPFFRDFSDLAEAADRRGWHERNGGNLTYRLTTEEVKACEALFHKTESWQALVKAEPHVGGDYYLVTGSGKWMRHVTKEPRRCAGIIEISTDG